MDNYKYLGDYVFVKSILEPSKEQIEEQNERLQNQIDTYSDMVYNAKLKHGENIQKLKEINSILSKIEKPSNE